MRCLLAAITVLILSACATPYHLPSTTARCVTTEQHPFTVYIAATDFARRRGFAGAPSSLIQNTAILFLYPSGPGWKPAGIIFGQGDSPSLLAAVHWYYNMRNMRAPLDIAFLNSRGHILAVMRMVPGTKLYRPEKLYSAALEMAAGRAEKLGLEEGAILSCLKMTDMPNSGNKQS